MSQILFTQSGFDEVQFFINYLTDHIAAYQLSKLTNGISGDVPSINNAHPLAMEYGNLLASGTENYTSVLPAIGVELVDDNPDSKQLLGGGWHTVEITQAMLTAYAALTMEQRYLAGIIMSDDTLAALQAAKTAKGTAALWAAKETYIQEQEVSISIWSNMFRVTRIVYQVVRALMKTAMRDASKIGIKNLRSQGQGALYNYDFAQTLFGAEFKISMVNSISVFIVDASIGTIADVEEYFNDPTGAVGPTFVPLS
jgi:hypothetical protein